MLIAGGAGVSVYPQYFTSSFDAVLPGEGEIVLKEYIMGINESGRSKSEYPVRTDRRTKGADIFDSADQDCRELRALFTGTDPDNSEVFSCIGRESGSVIQADRKDSKYIYSRSAAGKIQETCRHTKEGDFSLSVNTAHSDRHSVNISALLSRGCNNRCRFCSNFITHGRDFRKTSIQFYITGT